jgi:hypothetical protein
LLKESKKAPNKLKRKLRVVVVTIRKKSVIKEVIINNNTRVKDFKIKN